MEQPVWILPLVLDESIAVDVPVGPNPAMRRDERGPKLRGLSSVFRLVYVLRGDDEEQERRVDAPVVREIPLGQICPRSGFEAMLVQDLPRLLLRLRVHRSSLEGCEDAQCRCRNRWVEREALPCGDQGVSAEQRCIPRRASPKIAFGRPQSVQVLLQSRTN